MQDTCEWANPGHDRYTGSVPVAIRAYGLPTITQDALVAAFEAREFIDTIVIDRDTITGRDTYAPDIRSMHFGSRGKVCKTVTRETWAPEHVETALVVCAYGTCIAWPSVCGNVFRLTRLTPPAPLVPTIYFEHREPPLLPPPNTSIEPPFIPPPGVPTIDLLMPPFMWDTVPTSPAPAPPGYWPGLPPPAFAAPPPAIPPVASPVPEPALWAMLLAGFAAISGCSLSVPKRDNQMNLTGELK